jgi:SAM-dependent methyltransferase
MYTQFHKILTDLDKRILTLDEKQVQQEFESIPLEIFGRMMVDRPAEFPNIMKWMPLMPSDKVQQSWTGCSGHDLMKQSVSFIRIAVGKYHETACKPLSEGTVLDFGCGWGRLARLLYKYVPAGNIYGVDPWDQSIDLCRETNLYGNYFISDYLPEKLPIPGVAKFDLVIAFSVFTHLSEKAAGMALELLSNSLHRNGVLIFTIRPREYWAFAQDQGPFFKSIPIDRMLSDYDTKGFAFFPHIREEIDGEVTYGEASMSIDYLKQKCVGLKLSGIEWSSEDPHQMIVMLKKE